jgi:hypothetical protein
MKMPRRPDLKAALAGSDGALAARGASLPWAALASGNPLSVEPASLAGAHILIRTKSQFAAALTLVALDGVAARLVIAPPDLKPEHLADVIARARIDTLVTDAEAIEGLARVTVSANLSDAQPCETPNG